MAKPRDRARLKITEAGARFAASDLGLIVGPAGIANVPAAGSTGDTLFVVTSLAHSTTVTQGTEIAVIRVVTVEGRTIEAAHSCGN